MNGAVEEAAAIQPATLLEVAGPLGVIRAISRLTLFFGWTLACSVVFLLLTPLVVLSEALAHRLRRGVARRWLVGVPPILGTRLKIVGTPPKAPYFLVLNHPTWLDPFSLNVLCDACYIAEAPLANIPILGALFKELDWIFVERVKSDTARVNTLMVEAITVGCNIVLAPETPIKEKPQGSCVRQFRGGLLLSAVQTQKEVRYVSVTYNTPPGSPSASRVLVPGPNPFLRGPDGKILESEIKASGPPRSFFVHALGVLALPWHECVLHFGEKPIPAGDDRIALANALHDAVLENFKPLE